MPSTNQAAVSTMNGIIDTSPVTHPLVPLLKLLKPQGKLILIGAPDKPYELPVFPLIEGKTIVSFPFITNSLCCKSCLHSNVE